MEKKLPADVKQRWLEALRGGQYKKTTSNLHTDAGYCCLGVLCEVATPGFVWQTSTTDNATGFVVYRTRWGNSGMPDYKDLGHEVASVLYQNGVEDSDVAHYLAKMNDMEWDFNQIADWVEQHL